MEGIAAGNRPELVGGGCGRVEDGNREPERRYANKER
jgi:hypothetical protein